MASACAECGCELSGGGMMSSAGEVCESCFDSVEGSSMVLGPLDAAVGVAAGLPFLVQVWVNGLGIVHIGAGAVGVALGGMAVRQALSQEGPKNVASLGISGVGALVCVFHLVRGLGLV